MRAAKAQTSLRIRGKSPAPDIFIYPTSVNVCTPTLLHAKISLHTAHAVLSAPLFLEQNIKLFVGPDLGPNCPLKKSWGGGGGGLGPALLIVYQPQTKGQGNGSRTCV